MAEDGMVATLKRGRSSTEVIQQFNSVNAKILAALLVVTMLCYHGILKVTDGSDSCQWLLNKGRFQGDQMWQPYGCMLHSYSRLDATQCFRHSGRLASIVFIGDSRIRQLFYALLELIDPGAVPTMQTGCISANDDKARPAKKAHCDLAYENTQLYLKLAFFWRPVANRSFVDVIERLASPDEQRDVPKMLIASSGAWEVKLSNGSSEALESYEFYLSVISEVLSRWPDNSTRLLWKPQDPVDEDKLSVDRQMIHNEILDSYNRAALKVLRRSRLQIWQSARSVSERLASTEEDGLHLSAVPLKHHVQMLLNMHCNDWMDFHDGTCCRAAEAATTLQLFTFTVLLLCFVLTVTWLAVQSFRRRRRQRHVLNSVESNFEEPDDPSLKNGTIVNGKHHKSVANGAPPAAYTNQVNPSWQVLITSLGKLGLIMVYFYLCDRTNCFMKENKYYSNLNFWLPVGYICALGLFFNEQSRCTKVLHRDQTDEWKGWMQLVILIYHMTGASQVIAVYMHIRVLVSSYLFLTGYGHFCYFWNGGTASFVRFCRVLFRMNMMTVIICLCMNRPYQSYYFVPLVSFWYVVVYVTLVLPPQIVSPLTDSKPVSYLYMILKFIGLFSCITVLYTSEVFFEQIFLSRPWKALFVTPDDHIHEWWFRWSLDRYSICFGMVFGFMYVCAQKYGLIDESGSSQLWGRRTSVLVAVLSLAGMAGYSAFTFTCSNKSDCNQIHPYITFVPIVSFVILRNVFGVLRSRYSSFFAWFGRISLELFIGQYHIWLAADTHGILVLVPNYPVLNVIVTSYILVCVAHEINHITCQLVPLAVPSDWKRSLRNFVLFFVSLVPIGIHDGMF